MPERPESLTPALTPLGSADAVVCTGDSCEIPRAAAEPQGLTRDR